MKIEYYHASKYGNGAMVAEEFKRQMTARGIIVEVYHVREAKPSKIPVADLYLFSSPGRFGKPIGDMSHFLKKVNLPPGTKYGVLVTELRPKPDDKPITQEEELGVCQRVIPTMDRILLEKTLVKVADCKVFVTGIKGPLEEGWQKKVEAFATRILNQADTAPAERRSDSLTVAVA